ncbi:hypothetical protein NPX13_g10059 [Xylaria arbuscula]|uniref:DNA-binding protein RAP1 n=1 Tax=Xylaria arbuscula TaxID=114810 RepID=A0A9W8N5H4_9PEZI|nr:hypothetical protein NPX13_g10059 [Xylaria arbuscula]
MSAPGITYSGVLAEKEGNNSVDGCAGVFRGLKLWVSARVPNRKACVDTIERNGGTVVLKESSADMFICDQTKQPVPGSYSYQLIPDAVKEGSLDMKDNYLCDTLVASSRIPAKPVTNNKLTRVAYTKEDDEVLTKFVLEMEREGKSTSGNDIYKEFASKASLDTPNFLSSPWLTLRYLPRSTAVDGEQPPKPSRTAEASSPDVATRRSSVARSRARFTAEEDDIILETIRHAIENHEPWAGFPPYQRLASEFPQRTYQSWRERALNHVARVHNDKITQWEFEAGFSPSDKEDPPLNNDEQTPPTVENKSAVPIQPNEDAPMQDGLPEETVTQQSGDIDVNQQEDQDTTSPPIYKAGSPKIAVTKSPKNSTFDDSASPAMPSVPLSTEGVTTEGQFYRDYNMFLDNLGITERRIPTIRGKAITLWSLWQSIRSKRVDISELDWQQIAEDLGFDWVLMESVPEELRQCYEEYLEPFAEIMKSFNNFSDDGESTDEEPIEEDADVETEALLPSSPPVLPSLKRSLPAARSAFILQTSPKRRRIDRNQEIPSTPENEKGTWNLGSSVDLRSTPTRSRLGQQTPRRKRRLEPETQDFAFAHDTQAYTHDEALDNPGYDSDMDATPSQQLRLESDGISPHIRPSEPTLVSPRQEIVQTTPTPRRRIRRRETPHFPFPAKQAQPKRRTLPSSFTSKPPASPGTLHNGQPSSAPVPETEPHRRRSPPQETPDDIIDRFVSLGYGKDIVLRSLKATSWIIGNAGQVMEMLKQGEPLPQRTTGVWTQRDDDSLALVYSPTPPTSAKEERKREKEIKRLRAKHGEEQIALRKQYLLDEVLE